jgi:hypothetical protein
MRLYIYTRPQAGVSNKFLAFSLARQQIALRARRAIGPSASSKGTKAQPGKRVALKSGLNRAILDASPFELRRQWKDGRGIIADLEDTLEVL